MTRLITEYHVVAVVGEVSSGLSLAGGAVAQSHRVPMVVPSSTNERVTQIGNMVSRVCFIDGFQGYVVAKFAHDNLHATRVGILCDQQQACSEGLAREFDRAFRALGGTITTRQAYTGGDINLSAQLQSLKDTNPEAIARWSCSRGSASASTRTPARCPAGSSRCSRSRGRCSPGPGCCGSTSRRSAWHRRSSSGSSRS